MANLILIIASTGHGKTTTALEIVRRAKGNIFVFDYRGEKAYDHLSTDLNQPNCKMLGGGTNSLNNYIQVARKKPNTWLLVEEATIFLQGRTKDDMRELIVSKRHMGHNIILLFHTIGTVPPFLFDTAEYIILKKTGDDINGVKRKRPQLLPYFIAARNSKDRYFTKVIQNIQ